MNDAATVDDYLDQAVEPREQIMAQATTPWYVPVYGNETPLLITLWRRASGGSIVEEFSNENDAVVPQSPLTEYEYLTSELKADAIEVAANALERSLFADDIDTMYSLEEEALDALSSSYKYFAIIALNQQYDPDVRGVAARLFAESAKDDEEEDKLLHALATNGQPLVRLGLVYGLEDKTDRELLRQFVYDSHPRVRAEAQRLQAKA